MRPIRQTPSPAHFFVGPDNGESRYQILPPNDPRYPYWRCTDRFCPRYTVGTPSEATIRVINRSPTITVAAAEERVAEGEAARFELTRHWNQENLWVGGEWAVTVVAVRLGHSGGYVRVPLPDSVSFGVGQTRLTVEVPTADDELVGGDGAVTLELLPDPKPPAANPAANYEIYDHLPGVTPAGGNSRVATIVIADNDSTPVLAIEPAHASEDGGVMAFPVTLSGNGQRHDAVTVRWRTVDGTAVAGADYAAASGALTFAAGTGAATATVTVTVHDDREEEPSEVFSVELHAAEGAMFRRGGPTTAATGTIDDDDAAPVSIASITSHDDSHNQEGGHELFLVRLDPVPDESVTVHAQTVAGGTATAGVDYVASTQVLTFGPNDEGLVDGSWVFVVSSIEDAEDEPDETYLVRLSLPADSEVVLDPAASTVVGIILDDDAPSTGIALTAHPERVSEGGGAQEVAVTAALDGAARHTATTVSVAVAAGSAAPEDFTAVAAFDVVIGAGETRATATFSLVPVADAVAEPDETVSLRGAVSGAGSTAETALPVIGTTVTIADDDRRGIELAPRSLTVREGGAASYTVRLTSAPTEPVRVQVQVPADAGIVTDRASVEFTAETWNQARTVAVIANQDEDTDHGLVTIGHAASGGDYTGQPARELTVTVVDDDTPLAAVRLAVTPTTVPEAAGNEGRAIVVTATLDGAVRAEPTAIEVTVAGDTASAADFAAVSAIMLTIPAALGSAAATFTLRPVNDAVDETDETVAVSGATKEGLTVHGATAVIVDDDTRGVVVAPTALVLNEGDSAAYTVSLSSAPDGAVVVVKPQASAEQGVSVTPSVLTFTAADWATPATVTVTSVRDDDAEDAMTTVSHQVEGADYTKQQVADVVVRVADLTPRLAVADTAVAEGAGAARFVVSLDQTSTQEVTVAFATTDGTAQAGSDYTAAAGRLTFAPAVTERTITVTVADDTAPEVPEMFRLSLSEPTNAVLDGGGPSWTAIAALSELPANAMLAGGEPSWTAMAVIVDDDLPRVTVSALRPELTEGATAVFTLVRNGDASFPLTVTVDVSEDGEMLADGEETVREGTFDSGSLGVTMLARTVRDDVDEMSSRITASVRAGTGYEAGTPPPVVVTVTDDDTRGVTVTPAARTLTEDGSSVYTVALTSEPTGPVTVTATVSGNRDVTVSVQALTFTAADWRTVQTVTVRAAADDDAATIVHTVAGADYDGTPAESVAITVTDDDEAAPQLTLAMTAIHRDADGSGSVTLGDVLTYTALATNSGNVRLLAVTVNDTLVGGAVECASLAIGDDCELSGDYTVLQADVDAGQVENTATAGAAALGEEQTASVNTEVAQERGLSLAIEPAPASFAAVSDVITYTYRVRNSGTVTLHGTLGITDDTVVGITCSELPETGLAPAAATTCTGSYAVAQADVDAGAVHNRATATLDGLTSPAATAAVAWQGPQAGQPGLTLAPAGAGEDAGSLAFAVTLSRASAQTVTVAFASADLTAQAGVDYSEATGTLTFGPATMAATIAVAVTDDELAETEETFELTLSAAWNATLGAGVLALNATGTITDDDAAPAVGSGTALAVDEGQTAIPSGQLSATDADHDTAELSWTIADGAAGGDDGARFTVSSGGVLSLRAAQDYENPADADSDGVYEVTVRVSDGTNAATADLQVTLQDVLPVVTVAADAASVVEGAAAAFTLTRSGDLSGTQAVTVAVTDSAEVLAAGQSAIEQVTFADAAAEVALLVATDDDTVAERGATVTATVQGGGRYTVGTPDQAEIAVLDNDASALLLTVAPLEVAEGAAATAVVVRAAWAAGARAALTDLTVSVGADGDTATAAADYAPVEPFSLTIAAGAFAGSATFTLAPVADEVDEEGEALTVDAVAAASSVTVSAATLTIRDDDERGITVAPNALAVQEGRSADYTVQLTSEPTDQVTVMVSGTAGTDLRVAENTLTFSTTNWNTAQTVTVSAGQDDDAVADTATLTHTASGGDYGSVSKDLTVTVTDDDPPQPELTLEFGEPGHTDDDGSGTIDLGDKLTYTATVTNSGNVPLRAVAIRDLLIDTDGKQCGVLAIGESCELSGEYTVTQGDVDAGQVENTATAAAAELSADETASVITEVDRERGLSLAIEPPSTYVSVGAEIEYRYKVSNSGTVTLTGAVTIADDTVSGITCEVLPEGVLGPGEETTCTGRYRVQQGDVDAGQVANRATATLDGVTTAEATARVRWRADQQRVDQQRVDQQRVVPVVTVSGTRAAESVGTVELEVSLSRASEQTVTVGYETEDDSAIAGEDYTETSGTLTFGPGATARTIEVVVIDDAEDEQEETFEVTLSGPWNATLSGGDAELTGTATIVDDDTRGIELNPAALGLAEGASASYTVKLATQPTGPVTVTVGGTAGTDLSVVENTLTFSTTNWNTAQPVEVTARQDDDAVQDTATLTHTAAGADYGSVTKALAVTVTDDDTPELVLSKSELAVTEGASANYTVKLATQPTGPVTVTVDGTAGTDLSVVENTLTFSTTNWNTAQPVEVTAGQDDDAVEDTATLTHTATGGDYNSVTKDLSVTVMDNDKPGLVLSKATLAVTEGASASYTVKLATQPTGPVTVTVGGTAGTDLSVVENTLTFSTTNWNTAQPVEVTAGQDDDAVEDTATLTHTATGGDYNSVTKDLPVTVTDNDAPELVLSKSELAVTEGASANYTVKLATQPTGPVTVTVGGTSGTDLSVVENTLTFSRTSWNTAQPVEVTAGQDDDAVQDTATLTHTATGGDYNSVTKDLPVTVTDNDAPELVLSKSELAVTEGASANYTVKLATQPTGQVTVTVGGTAGTDLSVVENTLTFSRTSWNTAQPVEVTAGQDDDAVEDTATLTHTASGGDYNSVTKDLSVTVMDNDKPGLVLSKATLAVTEGASANYTVKLATQPTGPVTVTVDGTAGTDLSVVENTLTFSTTNWNTAQPVEVTAGQDDDAVEDTATLTHTATGGDYNSVTKDLPVTVTDNDAPELVLSKSELAVTEGASASYTVKLATQPTGPVTVTVGGTSGTDLSVVENTLTFSRTSWNTAQPVEVTAGQDDDAVEDTATLTHTATGGDYNSVTKDLPVTVTDNDAPELVLSKSELAVTEGASANYTVKLATQPTGPVTVTVGGTASTDLSVTENTLTFSATNWSSEQTVTVSAGEDDDASGDSGTLTHTASGGDYGSVSKELPVTVTDDDTPELVLSKSELAVTEGASASYTVKLATQPTGPVTVTVGGTAGTDLSVTENTLTFSTTNWNTAQPVEVTAGQDDDAVEDTATLTHTATGGDYNSVAKDLPVTVTDNDAPELVLSKSELAVTEGASASYTVKLATQPTGPVTVTVTVDGTAGTDLSVTENTLTFSSTSWSTAQTVTVSAGEDDDAVEDTATLTHTAAGGGYASVSKDLPVTVTDNDAPTSALSIVLGDPVHGDQDDSGTVNLGDKLTYTATVTNSGNVPLSGVQVSDLLVHSSGVQCGVLAVAASWRAEGQLRGDAGGRRRRGDKQHGDRRGGGTRRSGERKRHHRSGAGGRADARHRGGAGIVHIARRHDFLHLPVEQLGNGHPEGFGEHHGRYGERDHLRRTDRGRLGPWRRYHLYRELPDSPSRRGRGGGYE